MRLTHSRKYFPYFSPRMGSNFGSTEKQKQKKNWYNKPQHFNTSPNMCMIYVKDIKCMIYGKHIKISFTVLSMEIDNWLFLIHLILIFYQFKFSLKNMSYCYSQKN